MRATHHTRALDRALAAAGEVVVLRRAVPNAPAIQVQVRSVVRGYTPEELAGGVNQHAGKAILSAAELEATGFARPPKRGDKLLISGRPHQVEAANIISIGTTPIRHELQVLG